MFQTYAAANSTVGCQPADRCASLRVRVRVRVCVRVCVRVLLAVSHCSLQLEGSNGGV